MPIALTNSSRSVTAGVFGTSRDARSRQREEDVDRAHAGEPFLHNENVGTAWGAYPSEVLLLVPIAPMAAEPLLALPGALGASRDAEQGDKLVTTSIASMSAEPCGRRAANECPGTHMIPRSRPCPRTWRRSCRR